MKKLKQEALKDLSKVILTSKWARTWPLFSSKLTADSGVIQPHCCITYRWRQRGTLTKAVSALHEVSNYSYKPRYFSLTAFNPQSHSFLYSLTSFIPASFLQITQDVRNHFVRLNPSDPALRNQRQPGVKPETSKHRSFSSISPGTTSETGRRYKEICGYLRGTCLDYVHKKQAGNE